MTDPAAGAAEAASDPETDPELAAEQRHIDAAYARLDAMRRAAERVAEGYTEVTRGGTHQARLERDAAEAYTRRRLAALDIGDIAALLRPPRPAGPRDRARHDPVLHRPHLGHRRRPHPAGRSTGARRSPSPSTGRPRSSPWASPAAATSRPTAGASSASTTRCSTPTPPSRVGVHRRGRGRAARRARPGAHRPDARHRRHHPGRAGRGDPRRHRRHPGGRRAAPAPARPPSRCTAPRTSSTRTASGSRRRACCWSGRARSSCATSTRCSRRSARTK